MYVPTKNVEKKQIDGIINVKTTEYKIDDNKLLETRNMTNPISGLKLKYLQPWPHRTAIVLLTDFSICWSANNQY